MPQTKYTLQIDLKTRCPLCGQAVWLLCHKDGYHRAPWFYICYSCREVAEVGKSHVGISKGNEL